MNSTNLVNIKISIVISLSGSSSGSDFAMNRFDKDSEVYKMIQENKESRIPPRQSNTFKMLQEVLEADERAQSLCASCTTTFATRSATLAQIVVLT
uniref:PDZ and LIM domain-containing protein n=1 Tax=Takifugu rubripes TaxID=31033 RepID=A0A3B5KCY9_TAKRU